MNIINLNRKHLMAVTATALMSASFSQATLADSAPSPQEARQLIGSLATQLKSALQSAMKNGGPMKAIEACNLQAPGITASLNTDDGWKIGRTSLKVRNSDNNPDLWEIMAMNKFEKLADEGVPLKELSYSEIIEKDGKKTYRFMKAIPTQKACLACHGPSDGIESTLKGKINELYPYDQATGFKLGDIRGAFTVSKTLN